MKKLMSRYLVLVTLAVCLGLFSAVEFRADPYCPEGCHDNCRASFAMCEYQCNFDEGCIRENCNKPFNQCIAYCNWVCGPE